MIRASRMPSLFPLSPQSDVKMTHPKHHTTCIACIDWHSHTPRPVNTIQSTPSQTHHNTSVPRSHALTWMMLFFTSVLVRTISLRVELYTTYMFIPQTGDTPLADPSTHPIHLKYTKQTHKHTNTHIYTYIYIYIYALNAYVLSTQINDPL